MGYIKGFGSRNPNEKKGKERGEVEGGKNIIRMHYVRKKIMFNKRNNRSKIKFYRHKKAKGYQAEYNHSYFL